MCYQKKLIISAGGTGGHLYPAQALAHELKESHEVLFVAGGLDENKYFDKSRYAYSAIPVATFSFSKPWQVISRTPKIFKGFNMSKKIIKTFCPDAIIGFGSYYTLPILSAAAYHRIPIFLHEQNSFPGKVNRLFSRYARIVGVTFPESLLFFKENAQLVSFPQLNRCISREKDDPWGYFGLQNEKLTILVFGGSQGGRGLNRLFLETLSFMDPKCQVLHFTGNKETQKWAQLQYKNFSIPHCVKVFEERMDLAWEIADIAVTRAGAATINELIYYSIPAIVIPFPYAADNHQFHNAQHFTVDVGGGIMLIEEKTSKESLSKALTTLISKRSDYRNSIESYKKNKKTIRFADIIREHI